MDIIKYKHINTYVHHCMYINLQKPLKRSISLHSKIDIYQNVLFRHNRVYNTSFECSIYHSKNRSGNCAYWVSEELYFMDFENRRIFLQNRRLSSFIK